MIVNGWRLVFYPLVLEQLEILRKAVERAKRSDPESFASNANVKLLATLERLMEETIPADPARPDYRQGNTLGPEYRSWFRAKFMGRFRLFFRYDSNTKVIAYAWVNNEATLRKAGSKNDPYEVFRRMLKSGNPPNDWSALIKASKPS